MTNSIELVVVGLYVGLPGIPQDHLTCDDHGIREDTSHYGSTRIVNARSRVGYVKPPIGTVESNWRMFSAMSLEDLAVIQAHYNVRYQGHVGMIEPSWLGPNIVFHGMSNFSHLPDGTLLDFTGDDSPVLRVTSENKSCSTPGKLIATQLRLPMERAKSFVQDADGYRGTVGTVYRNGVLRIGMIAQVILPQQGSSHWLNITT